VPYHDGLRQLGSIAVSGQIRHCSGNLGIAAVDRIQVPVGGYWWRRIRFLTRRTRRRGERLAGRVSSHRPTVAAYENTIRSGACEEDRTEQSGWRENL
jgi:hypothetical protein